jgi:hypothetical protein
VNGRLASATFIVMILCNATCWAQDPEIPLSHVEIRLERSTCFGSCPAYTVAIHGDGRVDFDGKRNTAHRGQATWRIPVDDVVTLINIFLKAHFFDAAPRYERKEFVRLGPHGGLQLLQEGITDISRSTLTLKLGSREHSVDLYYGVPTQLMALPGAVDETATTAPHVTGTTGK